MAEMLLRAEQQWTLIVETVAIKLLKEAILHKPVGPEQVQKVQSNAKCKPVGCVLGHSSANQHPAASTVRCDQSRTKPHGGRTGPPERPDRGSCAPSRAGLVQ